MFIKHYWSAKSTHSYKPLDSHDQMINAHSADLRLLLLAGAVVVMPSAQAATLRASFHDLPIISYARMTRNSRLDEACLSRKSVS
jgi:hypothetical protein